MNGNGLYEKKIEKILQAVIQCHETLDYDRLELLLQKLIEKENGGFAVSPFDSSLFQLWLMETLNLLERSFSPPKQVIRFILNLTAILSRDEEKFVILNGNNVYSRIITLFHLRTNESLFQIEYINLLKNFTLHKPGLEYLLYTGLWEDIFNKSLCSDVEVSMKSRNCMAWFIEKIATNNEKLCIDIISKIMAPFLKLDLDSLTTDREQFGILEKAIHESLRPTMLLICNVFMNLLESPNLVSNLQVVLIFTKDFQLETYVTQLMEKAENKDFIFDLSKISFLLQFFDLCIKAKDTTYQGDIQMITNIMNICKKNILSNNIDKLLRFCHFGLKFWKKITKQIPEIILNCDTELLIEHQLVSLEIFPLYLISCQFVKFSDIMDVLDTDDLRALYVNKICKPLSEPTLRLAFLWRNIMTDHNYCFDQATKALSYVMESRNNYDRYHAIMIFQGLIYNLQDICHLISEQQALAETFGKEEAYLIVLLDCLATFIEEFSITWKESVESICVVTITITFLSLHKWKDEITVKGLKLMCIAIEKYMAPDLALLVDRICESNLAMIGPLLCLKLQESTGKVRASALQVLCIICKLANSKFMSFQKCVLDTDLPHLVLKIAIYDSESSVRTKAFQCITEMIRIDEFWKNLIDKFHDLNYCFIRAFHNERDGFVRKEIIATICETYSNHRLCNKSLMLLYETMMKASADIQCEVKIEGLKFWDLVIKNHLQEQGMIDGTFPAVTFSKEKRKIVTLTKNEIFKRLYIVLTQLSQTGCLTVLMTAIQDKCNLEVSKLAVCITQAFVKMLNDYDLNSATIKAMHCITSLPPENTFSPGFKFPASNGSKYPNQVIKGVHSILNGQNIDLSLYLNKQKFLGNNHLISPTEFLDFSQQDFDSLINESEKCSKGCDELEQLLDNILKSQELECHKMDCC